MKNVAQKALSMKLYLGFLIAIGLPFTSSAQSTCRSCEAATALIQELQAMPSKEAATSDTEIKLARQARDVLIDLLGSADKKSKPSAQKLNAAADLLLALQGQSDIVINITLDDLETFKSIYKNRKTVLKAASLLPDPRRLNAGLIEDLNTNFTNHRASLKYGNAE